ncbi:MAG TPA: SMI1/KNR4 family protein [Candidatus Angelobacter sp.]|nr:SMI1/KNR4 family protein [Candidatus Angelobacter sp.]
MMGEHRAEIEAEIRGRGIAITSCGQPCPEERIADAERQLSQALPAALRRLYSAFDGFRGPTNAAFLWPLFGDNGLVRFNLLGRRDPWAPSWHGRVILFGDNGVGDYWGLPVSDPAGVMEWRPIDGEAFSIAGASILEVWERAQRQYYAACRPVDRS